MRIWQEKYFPVFLILLNILLTLCIFDPRLFLGGDNITFMTLARSLLDGQGYRDLSHPDAPVFIGSPPGYPVFLASLMLILGEEADVALFKLASLALSCITLFFFYRILQILSLGKIFSLVTALFVVVNFNILYPNHLELSDVLFNTFLFASLYSFMSGPRRGMLVGIILAVLATYTRYAGIMLLFSLLAYVLLKKYYQKFWGYSLLSLTLILPWVIFVIAHGFTLTDILTGAPDAAERKLITIGALFQRWSENFQVYFLSIFPQDLFGWPHPPLWFGIFVTLVVLTGLLLRARSRFSVVELYFVLYNLLILSWPQVWSSERYILPIIYFVALYFAHGIFRLLRPKLFIFVLGVIILYNAYFIAPKVPWNYRRLQAWQEGDIAKYYPAEWVNFFRCCNWISENLDRQTVIVSRKPNVLFFQTGNRGFIYPFSQDAEEVYQKVRQADYILVDDFEWSHSTRNYLRPALYRHQQAFELVFKVPDKGFFVLKVKK